MNIACGSVSKQHRSGSASRFKHALSALRVVLVVLTLFASAEAAAQCLPDRTCVSGAGPTVSVAVNSRINVAPETPVGAPISERIQLAPYQLTVTQNGATNSRYGWFTFGADAAMLVPGSNGVFRTNVAGIGVRYFFTFPAAGPALNAPTAGDQVLDNGYVFWETHPPNNGGPWPVSIGRSVQFINLSPGAKSGTVTSIPVVSCDSRISNNYDFIGPEIAAYNGLVTGGTLSNRTCTIQPVADVVLPKTSTSQLSAIGSSAGPRNFSIRADCSDGLRFALRFNASTNFENPSISLLKNTLVGATAAAGYAIQVVDGGTGGTIDAATKSYQTSTDSTTFQQAFTARYYRFGATPSAGRIQSLLVYTLDYY